MKKIEFFLLIAVFFFAIIVRLYRFDGPIGDWHSWRQADTSAVSRNFSLHGYDLLHPTYDDISNIQTGKDNPHGYRLVEFPLFNIAQAGTYQFFGIFTIEQWGRVVTIVSSLLSILFIYLLTTKHMNKQAGFFAAFFYAFIPYNIYYGRVILPDPSMVMASLGGVYFFDRWLEENKKKSIKTYLYYTFALLFTAAAFLLKPYALFFTIPMIYLAVKHLRQKVLLTWELWVFAFFSLLPLIGWRMFITQYPEGVPSNTWLFNGNGIRFRPSFFRWILFERITKLISGYFGILLFFVALLKIRNIKDAGFFLSFLGASIVYVCVFATGNVQHDYYQILIMPTIAMFYGLGAYVLFDSKKHVLFLPIGKVVLLFISFGMFFYGWNQIKDFFNINNPSLMVAGAAVDKLTPKNAKIIAPYGGDTTFLYHTKRKGWPSFQNDIPVLVKLGADYLVLVNPTKEDYNFGKTYKIISTKPEYILFDLKQKP